VPQVRTTLCDGEASGSGFLVDETEVVTNRHVIEGAKGITIAFAGEAIGVGAVEVASSLDLAVLHLDRPASATATLGVDPRPGDFTWVVGYPHGSRRISNGRVVDVTKGEEFDEPADVLRSRAEVDPGNSGGPLQDEQGHVVGLVFAVEYQTGFSLSFPVSEVRRALSDLRPLTLRERC
jgi:S1-C subfamily serine protease